MRAQVVIENNSSCSDLKFEHGLSVFVEVDGEQWLLDTGQTDKIVYNAEHIGIEMSELTGIIISHGHYDHAGGAVHIVKGMENPPTVYAHQLASVAKYSVASGGSMKKPNGWHAVGEISVSWVGSGEVALSDKVKVFTLPQDAPVNERLTQLRNGVYAPDPFRDELFTLITDTKVSKLLYAGCTHHGLELLLPYVFEEMKIDKIDAFVGGLHLMGRTEEQIKKSLEISKRYNVEKWLVNHCTGEEAVRIWKEEYGERCMTFWTSDAIEI